MNLAMSSPRVGTEPRTHECALNVGEATPTIHTVTRKGITTASE